MTNKEAINLLDNLIGMVDDNQNSDYDQALKMAIEALKQPERPKGEWIDTHGNAEWYAREYRCSECGDTMLSEANFCPSCGADMRGGQDDES